MSASAPSRVTAVLGPTNTGKTYLAVERMLGHRTGMIGFPLRLLARENYDRICKAKGRGAVALVTGEEKIVPPGATYFVCTVESMPLDRPVDFLAVDEIQLAGDPERGHVFTDRLLHARGLEETMLLGADTIRPLLKKLVPEAEYIARPRFSTLSYAGPRKLTRLPPRSAVVAFSVADVYALAELVRRQRGGTAVVMGALSPRTRNAQVELFQSGAVDFLVATDAIGMGLNMDLDHVAFARLAKFDGRGPRRLIAPEIAQIAGRAGRHMSDGTFGTTDAAGSLEPEMVEAIESHRFDPLKAIHWRNGDLDFRALPLLVKSLEARPPEPFLIRTRDADDHMALLALSREPEIAALARSSARLRLLWEVCQIPDFRKILSDAHTRLLGQIFRHLTGPGETLPTDWVADQVQRIDRVDGDIDMLTQRIAHIRTWTYIAHRGDWLADPSHWQERARAVEDRLSDALHQSLTQRFVDHRHALLVRRMKEGGELMGALTRSGEVVVEGHVVGRMKGFEFRADGGLAGEEARHLHTAARRALLREMPARLKRFEEAEDGEFHLADDGRILWHGAAVARLVAGERALRPRVEVLASDYLDGPQRERLRRRLVGWLERLLETRLGPLAQLGDAKLGGLARGVAYQLTEALGLLPRAQAGAEIAALTPGDRAALGAAGVEIGSQSLWCRGVASAAAARLAGLLWAMQAGRSLPPLPKGRPLSFVPTEGQSEGFCQALGYRLVGGLAVRADALERLARQAHQLGRQGAFLATEPLRASVGCEAAALPALLRALGFRQSGEGGEATFALKGPRGLAGVARAAGSKAKGAAEETGPRRRTKRPKAAAGRSARAGERGKIDPHSPFAVLGRLRLGR
ncbi:MAG: helicase-related protein [Pseudomonadota bacterium]